ncbi:hypothetical protein LTR72_012259, partial [Exophiala xenobiotica]
MAEYTATVYVLSNVNITKSEALSAAVTVPALPNFRTYSISCIVVEVSSLIPVTNGITTQEVSLSADIVFPTTISPATVTGDITFWLGPFSPVLSAVTLATTATTLSIPQGVEPYPTNTGSITPTTSGSQSSSPISQTTAGGQSVNATNSSSHGLGQSSKIGIGIGLGIGVTLLALLVGVFTLRRRRRNRNARNSPPPSGFEKPELHGKDLPRTHGRDELEETIQESKMSPGRPLELEASPKAFVEL